MIKSKTANIQSKQKLNLGNRLLRRPDVERKTGKSRSAIYAEISNGTFPAPVHIGKKSVAWLEEEVDAWIMAQVEKRNQLHKFNLKEEVTKHG